MVGEWYLSTKKFSISSPWCPSLFLTEVLEKMRETESPFLMGIETVPADEGADILQEMDKAADRGLHKL